MLTNVYLAEIMRVCAEINDQGFLTTFCEYSGHVKGISVRVYEGDWKDRDNIIFEVMLDTDAPNSDSALKNMIVQLIQLLE